MIKYLVFLISLFFVNICYANQIGIASYYANKFNGRKTASGETFNNYKLTAAHKSLPFNKKVKITNLTNSKSVIVKINDRGPYIKGRVIDLSFKSAEIIDCLNNCKIILSDIN